MAIQFRRYQNSKNADSISSLGLSQGQPAILDMSDSSGNTYSDTLVVRDAASNYGKYLSSEDVSSSSVTDILCFASNFWFDYWGLNNTILSGTSGGKIVPKYLMHNVDATEGTLGAFELHQRSSDGKIALATYRVKQSSSVVALAIGITVPLAFTEAGTIRYIHIPGLPKAKTSGTTIGYVTLFISNSSISVSDYAKFVDMKLTTTDYAGILSVTASDGSSSITIPDSWVDTQADSSVAPTTPAIAFFHKDPLNVTEESTYSAYNTAVRTALDAQLNSTSFDLFTNCPTYDPLEEDYTFRTGTPIGQRFSVPEVPFSCVKGVPAYLPTTWGLISGMPDSIRSAGRTDTFPTTELGTFTAELTNCTTDKDPREAFYYRIGQLVFIACYLHVTSDTTSGGGASYTLSGLPFDFNPYPFNNLANGNFIIRIYSDHTVSAQFSGTGLVFTSPRSSSNLNGLHVTIAGWYMTNEV